jgi:hypothetical protein
MPETLQNPGAAVAVARERAAGLRDGLRAVDGIQPIRPRKEIRFNLERAPGGPQERECGKEKP